MPAHPSLRGLLDISAAPYYLHGDGRPGQGQTILAALSDAVARGMTLYIPEGIWLLDGQMTSAAGMLGYVGAAEDSGSEASIIGAGQNRTVLKLWASENNGLNFANLSRLTLQGFSIIAQDQKSGSGIVLQNVKNFSVCNFEVIAAYNNGLLVLDDCWYGTISDFIIVESRGVGFNGTTVDSVGYGLALSTSGDGNDGLGQRPRYIRIFNGLVRNVFASGINISESVGVQISNIQIIHDGYKTGNFHLSGYASVSVKNNSENVLISGVYGEGTSIGFLVIGSRNTICTHCIFVHNGEQGIVLRAKFETGLCACEISVTFNKIVDPGKNASLGLAAGIVDIGGDRNRFMNNDITSNDNIMEYGIIVSESSNNLFLLNNNVFGARICDKRVIAQDLPGSIVIFLIRWLNKMKRRILSIFGAVGF